MIRNPQERRQVAERLAELRHHIDQIGARLRSSGADEIAIVNALADLQVQVSMNQAAVEEYDRILEGTLPEIRVPTDWGRLLLATRIALGESQSKFARRVGTTPATVQRNEAETYKNMSLETVKAWLRRLPLWIETPAKVVLNTPFEEDEVLGARGSVDGDDADEKQLDLLDGNKTEGENDETVVG